MRKTIIFEGRTYEQGLGIPDYYRERGETNPDDWYWLVGSNKEENRFLNRKWMEKPLTPPITNEDNLK